MACRHGEGVEEKNWQDDGYRLWALAVECPSPGEGAKKKDRRGGRNGPDPQIHDRPFQESTQEPGLGP
jgi:hypothetical protein